MRYYLTILGVVTLVVVPWCASKHPVQLSSIVDMFSLSMYHFATVVNNKPKTIAGLQSKYNTGVRSGVEKVRILIVPGHEPNYGGAEYRDIKERDLVVPLSENLAQFLREAGKYQVFVTRDTDDWKPTFADYFKNHWDDIVAWKNAYKHETSRLISLGSVAPFAPVVLHNDVPRNTALRLYGITRWANEHDIDVIIHVHLNDYPGHPHGQPGKYSGFAIYVPSAQYLNSTTTHAVADAVFKRLVRYHPVSDMPLEAGGIIDDPELIAVGAYNTSDAPSMLIEYGYLYEPQFTNPDVRELVLRDLAYQTFLGIEDFFDPTNALRLGRAYDTLVLPHTWSTPFTEGNSSYRDIYALQTVLRIDGSYPPSGKSFNECPRTGTFGSCTRSALKAFQTKYHIDGEREFVGPRTLEVLNKNYGMRVI